MDNIALEWKKRVGSFLTSKYLYVITVNDESKYHTPDSKINELGTLYLLTITIRIESALETRKLSTCV